MSRRVSGVSLPIRPTSQTIAWKMRRATMTVRCYAVVTGVRTRSNISAMSNSPVFKPN
jgi:hypothetical protein